MIFWIYVKKRRRWVEVEDALIALRDYINLPTGEQICITSDQPLREKLSIQAALEIIRANRSDLKIIIGVSHPSVELVEFFRRHGAHEILAINVAGEQGWAGSTPQNIDLTRGVELNRPICPALHIHAGDPIELSVCAKRNNRLILVMRHFKKWCVSDYESCPYWRGVCDDF